MRAYRLQEQGVDTVEANEQLGFPADLRRYDLCKPMLEHLGISQLRLMTNSPRKIDLLRQAGIDVTERIPLVVNRNPFNEGYLSTKAAKLGHRDRKSVVQGKSVSARVDFGGRRIIKKKK